MNKSILKLTKITKSFTQANKKITIIRDSSLTIEAGQTIALIGPSGSGKSTFLQIAGLLDRPDDGQIYIDDTLINNDNDRIKTFHRKISLGFIYQFHHLLGEFTILENLVIPQLLNRLNFNTAIIRAKKILADFSLSDKITNFPSQLSGGEQQRVAIARSLINQPKIILADEPTGNLDPITANQIFEFLITLVKSQQLSLLIVTHNIELANRCDKIITIKDNQLVDYNH